MVQSIVCGACRAAVPYGRLSCPECGELLASVVGAPRKDASALSGGATEGTGTPGSRVATIPPPEPEVGPPASRSGPELTVSDRSTVVATAMSVAAGRVETDAGDAADEPSVPPEGGSGTTRVGDEPPPPATFGAPTAMVERAAWAENGTPGAYVPPPILQPAGPAAPARAWGGHAGAEAESKAGTAGSTPDPAATDHRSAGQEGRSEGLAPDAAKQAVEFVGWLSIAGAALAMAGFILPWSDVVIGASGVDYVDRWGLAGPGHILVLVGLLGIVSAAVTRERVPIWLGIGLPGLALGSLLVGLVWPYVVGPLGAQLGAMAVLVGALLLVAAGVAALLVDRRIRGVPLV
jgi:hypothetical protein